MNEAANKTNPKPGKLVLGTEGEATGLPLFQTKRDGQGYHTMIVGVSGKGMFRAG